MERWITPVLFAVVSGAVWYYNGLDPNRQAVFPLLFMIPGYEGMLDQGRLTWQLFAGIAGIGMVFATFGQIRAIRERRADQDGE